MRLPLNFLALGLSFVSFVLAAKPVKNLQVTFVGKKYDVDAATTVEEVQKEIQKQSGASSELPQLLFGGKKLESAAFLRDAGVTDGSDLSAIPDTAAGMQDLLKQAGIDSDKMDELMKSMGGEDGKMPSMEESMKMMSEMVNSPIFQEYMQDPERLEQSRQMILNNPMLKNMMSGMPGMEELLNDEEAWREAMQAAANMYKSMDPNQLMQSMMGNMGGLDGMPSGNGLFDGNLDNNAAAAALDELSEGDD